MANKIFNNSKPMQGQSRLSYTLGCSGAAIFFFLIFIFVGFKSVDAGSVGIVKSGGSISDVYDPGFHWVWPLFQSMDTVNIQDQKVQFQEIDAATQEQQLLKVDGTIVYSFDRNKVADFYQNVGVDQVEAKLLQASLTDYVKEATVLYPAGEVLNHRADIRAHALTALNQKVKQNYPGLTVLDIFITNMSFSDAYQKAIEDKQVAQQQVATAQQQQDKAKIDAQTLIIQAQGEAAANAAKTATLTQELIQYIATQKWDGKLPQVTGGSVPFINLPASKQ